MRTITINEQNDIGAGVGGINGNMALSLTLGNCPIDFAYPLVGAAIGSVISHAFLKNANIVYAAAAGAVVGFAMTTAGTVFAGNSTAA